MTSPSPSPPRGRPLRRRGGTTSGCRSAGGQPLTDAGRRRVGQARGADGRRGSAVAPALRGTTPWRGGRQGGDAGTSGARQRCHAPSLPPRPRRAAPGNHRPSRPSPASCPPSGAGPRSGGQRQRATPCPPGPARREPGVWHPAQARRDSARVPPGPPPTSARPCPSPPSPTVRTELSPPCRHYHVEHGTQVAAERLLDGPRRRRDEQPADHGGGAPARRPVPLATGRVPDRLHRPGRG